MAYVYMHSFFDLPLNQDTSVNIILNSQIVGVANYCAVQYSLACQLQLVPTYVNDAQS